MHVCVCVRPQAIRNNSCEMSLNNWLYKLYCFPVLPVIDGVGRCGLSSEARCLTRLSIRRFKSCTSRARQSASVIKVGVSCGM